MKTAATVALIVAVAALGTLAGFGATQAGLFDPAPSLRPHTDRTDLTRDECLALLMDGASGCYVGAGPDSDTYLEAADSPQQCSTITSPDPSPETGRSFCVVTKGPGRGVTYPIAWRSR